jgi:hypothetical protein
MVFVLGIKRRAVADPGVAGLAVAAPAIRVVVAPRE